MNLILGIVENNEFSVIIATKRYVNAIPWRAISVQTASAKIAPSSFMTKTITLIAFAAHDQGMI